jgi:4-amino-4-deoxy-L-arabinose transferase-like glycosyltransferase
MRRFAWLLALAVVLTVHATLLWIYYEPAPKLLWGDEEMYWRLAQQALREGRFEIDPLWPPLYPAFVAALLALGGGSLLWVQLAQTLLLVAAALLLRDLWRRWIGPGPLGDVLALVFLAYPPLVAYAHFLWPEVLHLFLLLGALWILSARRTRPTWMPVLGVVLGLALLTKSLLGPFLPALLLPVALEGRARDRALRLGLVLMFAALTIAPTVFSNWKRLGVPMIADSARFNLWVGLNDTSRKNFVDLVVGREFNVYQESAPDLTTRNEILAGKIRAFARERGVFGVLRGQLGRQYFRLFDRDSFLTDQLPGGVLAATGQGYQQTPLGVARVLRGSSYALYAALLVGAAVGVLTCPPRGRRWMWWMLAFLAYNLGLFLFLHVKTRYRVQFLPFLFFYALLAVQQWLGPPDGAAQPAGKWRWAAAAGAGALALFLAFGGPLLD